MCGIYGNAVAARRWRPSRSIRETHTGRTRPSSPPSPARSETLHTTPPIAPPTPISVLALHLLHPTCQSCSRLTFRTCLVTPGTHSASFIRVILRGHGISFQITSSLRNPPPSKSFCATCDSTPTHLTAPHTVPYPTLPTLPKMNYNHMVRPASQLLYSHAHRIY